MKKRKPETMSPPTVGLPNPGPTSTPWFERRPELFDAEQKGLSAAHPRLTLAVRPVGYTVMLARRLSVPTVLAEGQVTISTGPDETDTRSYEVTAVLPADYPDQLPVLYCRDSRIPRDIDRHVHDDGQACLCVPSEARLHVPCGSPLSTWFDSLVVPFLFGQYYSDLFDKWPWPDRSHGAPGIRESYEELIGSRDRNTVLGIIRLLAATAPANPRQPCPCGSGRRLKYCHAPVYLRLRGHVSGDNARLDLKALTAAS